MMADEPRVVMHADLYMDDTEYRRWLRSRGFEDDEMPACDRWALDC